VAEIGATCRSDAAILEGRPPGPDSDPVLQLVAAGQNDPDAARGFLDVF
jgi:hypothetical protein